LSNSDAKNFSPATPSSITGFTKSSITAIEYYLQKTIPDRKQHAMNPDSGNGKQGLATANNPKVGYFEYDG